jgi:hypothetical protein
VSGFFGELLLRFGRTQGSRPLKLCARVTFDFHPNLGFSKNEIFEKAVPFEKGDLF